METLFVEDVRAVTPERAARKISKTREPWLMDAATAMVPWLKAIGAGATPEFRVSVGWPLGRRKMGGKGSHAIGQCFDHRSSKDGKYEIFISPELDKPGTVLHVLLHELVHAFVGLEEKHGGDFKKIAMKIGLVGKMTATEAGPELVTKLAGLANKIGAYPHAELIAGGDSMRPKQGTRMLKIECPKCGYSARTTQKWLDVGVPTCVCGVTMVGPDGEEEGDE